MVIFRIILYHQCLNSCKHNSFPEEFTCNFGERTALSTSRLKTCGIQAGHWGVWSGHGSFGNGANAPDRNGEILVLNTLK